MPAHQHKYVCMFSHTEITFCQAHPQLQFCWDEWSFNFVFTRPPQLTGIWPHRKTTPEEDQLTGRWAWHSSAPACLIYFYPKGFWIQNFLGFNNFNRVQIDHFVDPQLVTGYIWTHIFFSFNIFWDQKQSRHKVLRPQQKCYPHFWTHIFWTNILLDQNNLENKKFQILDF